MTDTRRWFTLLVWLSVAAVAALVAFTAAAGFDDSTRRAWPAAVMGAGAAAWAMARRRPAVDALIEAATPASRRWFTVGAVAVIGQLLLLTAFIIDPNIAVWRDTAWRPVQSRHSCLSAYWTAACRVTEVPDLYVESFTAR